MIKIAKLIKEDTEGRDLTGKKVVIAHVNCFDRAKLLSDRIKAATEYSQIEIVKCSGLNTTYASNGGIIVSYNI